jgi:predicted polyphosphate/ATP-dependent NAD kinase
MTSAPLVGIIANPASGKDIRRLVAHGSTFDNNEKINIVRRVLLGLDAAGVERVAYLPDDYGIVERAALAAKPRLALEPLAMPVVGYASDSTEAAARMADLGAGVIVTLGGDGTNRAVAKGCRDVPLVPVSTGTNNVFPRMIEGTLAGLAAGLVTAGIAHQPDSDVPVIRRSPRLVVQIDNEPVDIALIDVVTSTHAWLGARTLWEPDHLREVVLSRITPAAIGIASLGSALFAEASGSTSGGWIAIGSEADAPFSVTVPIAPGLMRSAPIAASRLIAPGENVTLQNEPCTIALDGEREIEFRNPDARLSVTLDPHGPRVVDVEQAIKAGALAGAFRISPSLAS